MHKSQLGLLAPLAAVPQTIGDICSELWYDIRAFRCFRGAVIIAC